MKALFLSAAIALASMSCFAQASDHSTVHVGLVLSNIIQINPPVDGMGAIFNSASDYTNGEDLVDIWGNPTSDFSVYSNRNFNVTIKAASATFSYFNPLSPTNPNMPCSILKYRCSANSTGGTNNAPSFTALSTSNAPLISGGTAGANKQFSVRFKADPGWSYGGGLYGLDVVLTATQL
ncbi:hypothetical protein [Chitinophaga sp. CB10]|uniref:hypothetical protein n=1 Tax=Chitinophaga sp. CB10 TaxID=1891659 RepID=UPI0025B96A0E|nr:hypothetical protein [Chitinophaga sp. CB10]